MRKTHPAIVVLLIVIIVGDMVLIGIHGCDSNILDDAIPSKISIDVSCIESMTFEYANMGKRKYIYKTADMLVICAFINNLNMTLIPDADVKNPSQRSLVGGQMLRLYLHGTNGETASITYHSGGAKMSYLTAADPHEKFVAASAAYGHDGELFFVKPERLVYSAYCDAMFTIWSNLDYEMFQAFP